MRKLLYCKTCWVNFPDVSRDTLIKAHIKSNNHQNSVKFDSSITLTTPYFCFICLIECNSSNALEDHKKGSKHKNRQANKDMIMENLDLYEEIIPELISELNILDFGGIMRRSKTDSMIYNNSVNNSENYLKRNETQLNLQISSIYEPLKSIINNNSDNKKLKTVDENNNESPWCKICYLFYTSTDERLKHINGKAHKKRSQNKLLIENDIKYGNSNSLISCEYCWEIFPDKSRKELHLSHTKHLELIRCYNIYNNCNGKSLSGKNTSNPDESISSLEKNDSSMDESITQSNNDLSNFKRINDLLGEFLDKKLENSLQPKIQKIDKRVPESIKGVTESGTKISQFFKLIETKNPILNQAKVKVFMYCPKISKNSQKCNDESISDFDMLNDSLNACYKNLEKSLKDANKNNISELK